jgi:lysophospholipase L1-like esterase
VELRVFAVGDSVMLGAARELQKTIPGIEVDAKVSRHVGATLTILQQRRAAGRLGKIVVVQIGNNGYVTAKQFDDLMQPLIDLSRVVVVNLKVPRKWEAPNNQVIADGVARYPNAVLVDWHTFGVAHPELFAPDGIHIGAAGAKAYTALVLAQIDAP